MMIMVELRSREQIASNLRTGRKRKGLTMMQMTVLLSCSYRTYYRWEHALRPIPAIYLRQIADILSMPVSLLLP